VENEAVKRVLISVVVGCVQLNQLMELTRQLIGDVQNQRPLDHMLKVRCSDVWSDSFETLQTVHYVFIHSKCY